MSNKSNQTVESVNDELDAIMAISQLNETKEVAIEEEIDEMEMMLNELELEEIEAADVLEDAAVTIEDDAELDETSLRELDAAVARKEVYESQKSAAVATADKKETTAGGKKPKAARGPATPRVERDLVSIGAEFFVLSNDNVALTDADMEAMKVTTLAAKPAQVKIAEKFENLFQAISAGKVPSRYTTIAFNLLDTNKTISSADLIAAYRANGCGDGTARSQTGQMMVLFNTTRIADRVGHSLTLRTESLLAERLRTILTA